MTRDEQRDGQDVDPFAGLPDLDERICEWVDGCLSERERARFEAELRVSPQLRQQLEEYEATVADLRDALQQPTVEVSLADRVMATIAAQPMESPSPATRWRGWPLAWTLASAAAVLVVVVWMDALAPSAQTDQQASQMDVRQDAPLTNLIREAGRAPASPSVGAGAQPGDSLELGPAAAVEVVAPAAERAAPLAEGPATAGPAGPTRVGGRYGGRSGSRKPSAAAAPLARTQREDVVATVTFELAGAGREAFADWVAVAAAQRRAKVEARGSDADANNPVDREAVLDDVAVRGWFAAEALETVGARPDRLERGRAGEARSEASSASLFGALRVTRAASTPADLPGSRAWVVEGSRAQVRSLLEKLARCTREVEGEIVRGEEKRRLPLSPPAAAGEGLPIATERVVLRFRAQR